MDETWIPIILFFLIFAGVWVVSFYRHVGKLKKLETIVKLAESGGEVKPEMINMLGKEASSGPVSDMRKGLIWIAIGIPIILAFLAEGEMVGAAFGTAPLLIGVAYLVVMKFGYSDGKPIDSSPL